MKKGNSLGLVVGCTVLALIAFSGGYYSGLSRKSAGSSAGNERVLLKKIAEQQEEIQSFGQRGRQALFQPDLPPGSLTEEGEENPVSTFRSIRELLLQARAESNPIARLSGFSEALSNLNEDNLDEVLEAYESMPFGFEHMQEYRMLLYAWGQFDAPGAIEYCNKRASGMGAGFATTGVIEGWASRDPVSASEWVQDPKNAGMSKLYNMGLVKGWASRDLQAASKYVESLEPGEDVGKLVGTLSNEYSKQGFGPATRWAEGLADEKMKEAAFANLSRQVSRDNPETVAEWLQDHVDQPYAVKSFENLGKRWSETEPESAMGYFEELPEGKARNEGVEGIMGNWAKKDPQAAGEWLNEKEVGPGLDPVLSTYARVVSNKDGAGAMEWAVAITEPKLQEKTVRQVGQNWYRQDKEAVDAWLPQSELSPETQKAIQSPPKQNWWQKLTNR
ncbi:MAG: hypothetical protein HN531_13255 [Opitutae bacterium]|nr:hypothetical protein [Opitutae bacterium]